MGRIPRFVLGFTVATIGFAGGVRQISAQTPANPQNSTDRRLALPAGSTAGLPAAFWRKAIGNGGPMPSFERLLVIGRDGLVLGQADGDNRQVLLPEQLSRDLNAGTVHATLVHNHPAGVSLSGDDLSQLGKPGVDRVIAVGHDGSVFEATIGVGFDREIFDAAYRSLLSRVMDTIADEARRDGAEPASLTPLVCHVVATILDRNHVIQYRTTPSLELRVALDRYHHVVQSTVSGDYNDRKFSR